MVCWTDLANRCLRFLLDLIASSIGFFIKSKPGLDYLPSIRNPLLLQPVVELVQKIKKGEVKCKQLVEAYIQRIKEVDFIVNAVVDQRYAEAIKEAEALDDKIEAILNGEENGEQLLHLPLLGIPFTGKDSIAVSGLVQTAGLFSRKGVKGHKDAVCVSNLRKAGAIPIAVTNVPELCIWFDSDNKIYGRTNNPYDLARIPGGSTGGNAACIAYAGSVVGVGSDIGGSIRIPCFFCGVFGHKTTPEIVPIDGHYPDVVPNRHPFLSFGPITRYAVDLIPMLKAMAGDAISRLPKINQEVNLRSLKFYYMECSGEPLTTPVDPEIAAKIQKVAGHMQKEHGCFVEAVSLDKLRHSFNMFVYGLLENPSPTMAEEMAAGKGEVNLYLELLKYLAGSSVHTLPMIVVGLVEKLTPNKLDDPRRQLYLRMVKELKKELHQLLGDDGILLYPAHPEVAPKHKTTLVKMENSSYTAIFNLLFVPITQVPLGLNKAGVPIGCQVIAGPYNDHLTIAVAKEVERAFGGWVPPCKVECSSLQKH